MTAFKRRLDALRAAAGQSAPNRPASEREPAAPVPPIAMEDCPAVRGKADGPRQSDGGSGRAVKAAKAARLAELRERLAQLGAARTVRAGPQPGRLARCSDGELAGRLNMRVEAPGLLVREERFEDGRSHGSRQYRTERTQAALQRLSESAGTAGLVTCPQEPPVEEVKPLFFDTETTGLSGGSGTVAFVLGTAVVEQGGLVVRQFLLTAYAGEGAMLAAFEALAKEASLLVSFNGKSFDAPLLTTRSRLQGQKARFAELPHVDLLHPLRRAFSGQWDNCRLASAETELLRLQRHGDLPGELMPQVWLDWIHRGDDGQFAGVLEHNWIDVVSMALLAPELVDCEDDPISYGANPRVVLGRDRSNPNPDGIEYLCNYRATLDPDSKHELAGQARRQGNWGLAAELWQELAGVGDVLAIERLAKYFEHQVKDFAAASYLTTQLLELAPGDPAHRHREARLKRKLARSSARAIA